MRTQTLLAAASLLALLSACTVSSTPLPDSQSSGSLGGASGLAGETSSPAGCENLSASNSADTLKPLSNPENTPVFEQFNFRPQEIAIADNTVTFTTAHHIFSFCKSNNTWSIVSANAAEDEAPYNYEQALAEMADPSFESITLNDETYEYRIRLQAEWLSEQLKPETTNPEAPEPEPTIEVADEDAVFFELKKPDGEILTSLLYTLSDVQTAQLGASLGAPSIAGTATAGNELWFAATTSQGEGDSGFASLINYNSNTGLLSVEQPETLQGDQLTSLAITGAQATGTQVIDQATDQATDQTIESSTPVTLWLGTQRSGEGNPYFPASGLVAYHPGDRTATSYTHTNSPLVGAIPFQLGVEKNAAENAEKNALWIGTGSGICEVNWPTIEKDSSWNCWKLTATAELPEAGVDLYKSFLDSEPAVQLKADSVEVLWVTQTLGDPEEQQTTRYEVVYEPGFETQLPQGGYRLANEAAQRAAGGNEIFWPGRQWHWQGDRFARSLDEVSLNLVGGGPYGLVDADSRSGFDFDNNAIRGDFDLLSLTSEATKVRYYSGWIEATDITVYPTIVAVETAEKEEPNPLPEMTTGLTVTQGP